MKVVAFIPVKLNNERLPGKNTKPFSDGTPLINLLQKSLVNLKKNNEIDEIYVYCSDDAIKEYLFEDVIFLSRPKHLDDKNMKGTEIYQTFVNTIDADVYVLAHVTSPFVKEEHISKCIQKVVSGEHDSSFCAKKLQNFLWQDNKPINFVLGDPPRTQDMLPIYCELSTALVFTKETFELYKSRTGINPYICECSEIESIDIDYQEDFDLAEFIYINNK